MREPVWVRDDVVRAIHLRQLAEHRGAQGIRDAGLLDSALARPKHLWAYSAPKPDLAALAAYAFGVINNHPFIDGNKRTGLVALRTFLLLNEHDIEASQEEKYVTFLSLASGTLDEPGLAEWVRARLKQDNRRRTLSRAVRSRHPGIASPKAERNRRSRLSTTIPHLTSQLLLTAPLCVTEL